MMISSQTNFRHPNSRIGQGFTILELIVALSVTVLMLVMISALFTATSDGVSMGMALSDVIGAGRAIGDQVERDVQRQFSPVELTPGVLVIVCDKLENIPYRYRRVERTRSVRSDQFMFLRDKQGGTKLAVIEEPITPVTDATFASATRTQMINTRAIRVWYGHVLKTNDLGTGVTALGATGRNKFANEWALGRHALFFVGDVAAAEATTGTPPAFNHSSGGLASAGLSGHVSGGTQLFQGITDVAYLEYNAPKASVGTFLGGKEGDVTLFTPKTADETLWEDLGKSDYDSRALAYMFLDGKRLWANPFPRISPTVPSTWVTAAQIAQMHPLLMDNISDFIVEFAADAVDDPAINGADFDGEPDRNTDNETIWYGLADNEFTNSKGPPTWRIPATLLDQYGNPILSPVAGSSADRAAYVFRHGAGYDKLWPYMIRIRYRVHDVRGDLLGDKSFEVDDKLPDGTGTNSGRWFEQIIKVKRE